MNLEILFQELAKIQKEILSKQSPFTVEEAREQVKKLKAQKYDYKRIYRID
jgi:hypothetical protein